MALLTERSEAVAVMSDINVTPFTDVLLVLLVVFMILAAVTVPPGFMRETPNRCTCSHAAIPVKTVAVGITPAGRIFIGGRATTAARIYADLAAALAAGNAKTITLEAGARTPYGAILRVLDAAKADGDVRVKLVTE